MRPPQGSPGASADSQRDPQVTRAVQSGPRPARQAARIVGHILPSTGRLQPPSVLRINRKQRFFYFPILSPNPQVLPLFLSLSLSLWETKGRRRLWMGGMVL